jgi:hypothetical protein
MKPIFTFFSALALVAPAFAAEPLVPDLKSIAQDKNAKSYRITAEWAQDDGGKPALKLKTVPGEDGLVLIGGVSFTNGVIEFDAKGKNGPPQSNFIGVAFRVEDGKNYDVVYFRPFNFRATEAERRGHAVQYTSLPDWPWPRLRSERTGQFEKAIEPAPDGDGWFHARIVVQKPKVSVFVNDAQEPSLVVNELTGRSGGSVALWCNGFGSIANLKISPQP